VSIWGYPATPLENGWRKKGCQPTKLAGYGSL
jgi:hypothetical protein